VSEALQKRQEHQSKEVRLMAWKAQLRLHKRFRQLAARKKSVVAATAVARELVGFLWAIACQVKPAQRPAAPKSSAPAAARSTGSIPTRRCPDVPNERAFKRENGCKPPSKTTAILVQESHRWRAGSRFASAALARITGLGKDQRTQPQKFNFAVD